MRYAKFVLAVPVLLGLSASSAHAGLIITPTFGASINGNANSAAIQATINSAISVYAIPSVPEASTMASFGLLLALGLGGFAAARRKNVTNTS